MNFKSCEELVGLAQKQERRVVGTQINEDSFHFETQAEEASDQKKISLDRLFGSLVDSPVMSTKHHFTSVVPSEDTALRAVDTAIPDMYKPDLKAANEKLHIKNIPGYKKSPDWNSPGPSSASLSNCDFDLVTFCRSQHCTRMMNKHWLVCLLRGPNLLVKLDTVPIVAVDSDGAFIPDITTCWREWRFNLGEMNNMAGVAWPAVKYERADGKSYFMPNTSIDTATFNIQDLWCFVVNPDHWSAQEYIVETPMSKWNQTGLLKDRYMEEIFQQ